MYRLNRLTWLVFVLMQIPILGSLSYVRAQGTSAEFVGINEKLGGQVALDTALKDEDGNATTLRQLINKPTILTLNYFRCAGICTPLLNGLADALNRIQMEPDKDFQVITVSFDPTDTPEVAHQKRINYLEQIKRQFPPTAWRFLTGEAQNTRNIADSVGFGYRAEGDQFVHMGAIMILTPDGKVSRYVYGTFFQPADLKMAILDAARGRSNPTIANLLSYCYSYDPKKDTYVFNATRIIGIGTLIIAGIFVIFLVRGRNKAKAGIKKDLSGG